MEYYCLFCLAGVSFTKDQLINICLVLVGLYTAIILFRTLKEGQRQSKEAQQQTGYSLAINQYNILYQDLVGITKRFAELNFKEIIKKDNVIETSFLGKFHQGIEEANGMNISMIYLFRPFLHPENEKLTEAEIIHFRIYILFPLLREYVSLYDFLKEVKSDKILSDEYKNRFYKIIERDILQSYFRVCNYSYFNDILKYNFSKLQKVDLVDFFAINNFYIENNLFQYNNLEFYQQHT